MAVYTQIDNPELYFQCKLYTGTGSAASITLDGDEDMQPDLVWFKKRSSTESHYVYDAVRGVTKEIYANSTAAEDTDANSLTGFNSDGFSIGNANQLSESNETMVAWCWKESATAGFDIVGYTGNGSNRTISHSLSAVPHVKIVKSRGGVYGWQVYHHKNTSAPETDYLELAKDDATADNATSWNDTAPTSSVFSLGTTDAINKDTVTHIAYLFTEKQGVSKFGSYVTNNSTDGPFCFCGFRPAFLMVKFTSQTGPWIMVDNKRDPFNQMDAMVRADTDAAEADTSGVDFDFLSNGFKVRGTSGWINEPAGSTICYMAFAEAPFVNSNGVPCNAR